MAKRYRMTARRRAALKKAQLASARKRARSKKVKRAAIAGVGAAAIVGAGVARHKLSGSGMVVTRHGPVARETGKLTGSRRGGLVKMRQTTGRGKNRKVTGRSIGYQTRKRGPLGDSKTVRYQHNKLTATMIGNKIATRSPRAASIGRQLNFKTRAMRGKMNPNIPMYQGSNVGAFGAYGKRMGNVQNYVKRVGGKRVTDRDMFGRKAKAIV